MLRLRIFALVFCVACFCSNHAHAANEFTTSLESRYEVGDDKLVRVTNTVKIKNNFSTMYASQYAFMVDSETIQNIQVKDISGKVLRPNIVHTDHKTSIAVVFDDKLVGREKVREFTVSYEHPDVSVMSGTVLEVDVPKLAAEAGFQQYAVVVSIPEKFGDPSAVSPARYKKESVDGRVEFSFGEDAKNGINMLFGQQQSFRFSLRYNIKNPSVSQGIAQIALPPDTEYQRVRFDSIDPLPERVEKDGDGNWIATFTLSGQKEQLVEVSGIVSVFLLPNPQISTAVPDDRWLQSAAPWPVRDMQIKELAEKHKTPRAIYNYVVSTLKYDYDRLQRGDAARKGALAALQNPNASLCQDFSDLFISIARAAGIPAREVTGFAYTENPRLRPTSLSGDVLHAWPEYFDRQLQRWVPVDPTWQATTDGVDYFSKLDFHHVAFALRGLSAETPYPAGMYKIPGQSGKDIQIEAVPEQPGAVMNVELKPPEFGFSDEISIRNLGGSAWYNVPVFASSADQEIEVRANPEMLTLLPYESKKIRVAVKKSGIFQTEGQTNVSVRVGTEAVEYQYAFEQAVQPFYLAVGGGVLLIAAAAGSVLVLRKKRHSALRRESKKS